MAFPFAVNLDPLSVLEFMAGLSEDEYDDEQYIEDSSDDEDDFSEGVNPLSTQEGMVRRFRAMRAKFVQSGGVFEEQAFAGNTMDDGNDSALLRTLKPMTCKELEVGKTHRGRYLCGWVAIDDAFFGVATSSLILEDLTGSLVEIVAYGLVDPELPAHERQCILSRRFAKGQPIVVIEPHYKERLDESKAIRVDQADKLLPWRDVPTDVNTWKELGNKFYSASGLQNEGHRALECYQRALKAVGSDVHTLVLLLTNLATCRFKMGDFGTAIQLSGAAVHLDPAYFKGWFRLASASAASGLESLTARIVAHARRVSPTMSFDELQLLKNTLKTGTSSSRTAKYPEFQSFAEWCVKLETPGSVLTEGDLSGETKSADEWRKEGSAHFAKGEFGAAEKCYRKGLASSRQSNRDTSTVLNNVAAVHLKATSAGNDGSANSEDEIPHCEAALLNCTVAGIIDPLNFKAWLRRVRCLQSLGFSQEICIRDLQAIRTSVVSMTVFSKTTMERLNQFQRGMDADIQKRLQHSSDVKLDRDSKEPQPEQRQERHADTNLMERSYEQDPLSGVPPAKEDNIDDSIASLDELVRNLRSIYAGEMSPSRPRLRELPHEVKMFLHDTPPKIYTEFPDLRGWPEGIDAVYARKLLYRAYLQATLNPWTDVFIMRDGGYFGAITAADQTERWHGKAAMRMLRERGTIKFGDIFDGREALQSYVRSYEATVRTSFISIPNRSEFYFFNSTHVAIGFTDFSGLLTASFSDESKSIAPLRWVGFDMSEFTVAKCKVVAHMLGSSSVPISSVMEVWLSSTWSEATLKNFRESVNAVLASLRGRNENPKVMSYLTHWASVEPVSAAEARCSFISNLEKHNKMAFSAVYSFRRELDRLDLAQYMLSGEIRASAGVVELIEKEDPDAAGMKPSTVEAGKTETGQTKASKRRNRKINKKEPVGSGTVPTPSSAPLVGNVTMCNVPPGSPPLRDDIALNTVEFTELVDDYIEREKKQKGSCDRLSVVDLFIIRTMKNLSRLRDLILRDKLTIEVNYGVVKAVKGEDANDPVNKELLARIARMRPRTMSWSSLLDNFLPGDFHDIARRCSMYSTCVHSGYCMQGPTHVFGASIKDFNPAVNKSQIDAVLDSSFGFENESLPAPHLSLDTMLKEAGLDKLVSVPFREHAHNGTAFTLAQWYGEDWVDHFVKKGELTNQTLQRLGGLKTPFNCGLQKGNMDLMLPNPLYRSPVIMCMSWCYDPSTDFVETEESLEPPSPGEALLGQLRRQLGVPCPCGACV